MYENGHATIRVPGVELSDADVSFLMFCVPHFQQMRHKYINIKCINVHIKFRISSVRNVLYNAGFCEVVSPDRICMFADVSLGVSTNVLHEHFYIYLAHQDCPTMYTV